NILHFENRKSEKYDFSISDEKSEEFTGKTNFIDQERVINICRNYGIPLVDQKLYDTKKIRNFENIDFPIVLKGISKKVIHKTDFNAVRLNIKDLSELNMAIDEMENIFNMNNIPLEQYLVQPFVEIKHELLLGGFRDHSFGPIVMFGSGGKYVEVLDDTRIKSAYMNEKDIDDLINETKIGKIINGVRGEKAIDTYKLKNIIKSVSRLMLENKNIMEIDINPLTVGINNELSAVDVRIKEKINILE
ncbi:MAG: acetate--CoA ligase family protein, partial [Melioribacteraceae bacterium]|nr:acetate--CoA ligase family protein [Melioribacteraceae bacterium]